MNQDYKSIFLYNQEDELITFVDIATDSKLISYYDLRDRKLIKINNCEFKEHNKKIKEERKAIIIFDEDCSLTHIFIDNESRVVAQKKDCFSRQPPKSTSKIYSHNSTIESFTINENLIQNWLKKL